MSDDRYTDDGFTDDAVPGGGGSEEGSTGEITAAGSGNDGVPDNGSDTSDTGVHGSDSNDGGENKGRYERYCVVCHRSESRCGRLVTITDGVYLCQDCMQKTFDSVRNSNIDFSKLGNVSVFNMADFQKLFQGQPKVKKKPQKEAEKSADKGEEKKPVMDIKSIPAPHKIKAHLDEYVIGQEHAKKVLSVAVYNHYKRVATGTQDEIEIEKSNILMIGPTGSGKTYLVKTLAKLLDVPLAIADATSLTEAGYIGDDIESVLSKLLAAANDDVEEAEKGIVFIDEIDKIAKKKDTHHRDVSGESVQQGLLKLLEGSDVEVPVGAGSKNAMVPMTTVNTKNILFICGGAFPELEDVIKERLNKKSSMGFQSDLRDKYDSDPNILSKVNLEDLRNFGMIPEFLGRLPVICTLERLTKDMLVRILKEPKNAILKQYQKLLALDEVELLFDDDALEAIAEEAIKRDTGARALRAIIEEFMLDIMYEIPKDDNIGRVTITRGYIEHTGGPVIAMRGMPMLESKG